MTIGDSLRRISVFLFCPQIHAAVAQWYERTYRDNLDPFLPVLAHHWSRTPRAEVATGYLERAAVQALGSFANAEAVRFLNVALGLIDQKGAQQEAIRRSRWEWWLGRAHLQLNDNVNSRRHLEASLALLKRPLRRKGGMALSTFIGLVQPLGAIMPVSERQAELVAAQLSGRYTLPSAQLMDAACGALPGIDRQRRAQRHEFPLRPVQGDVARAFRCHLPARKRLNRPAIGQSERGQHRHSDAVTCRKRLAHSRKRRRNRTSRCR